MSSIPSLTAAESSTYFRRSSKNSTLVSFFLQKLINLRNNLSFWGRRRAKSEMRILLSLFFICNSNASTCQGIKAVMFLPSFKCFAVWGAVKQGRARQGKGTFSLSRTDCISRTLLEIYGPVRRGRSYMRQHFHCNLLLSFHSIYIM